MRWGLAMNSWFLPKLCVFWNNFVGKIATFHIQPIPTLFSRKNIKIKSHDSKQSQNNNSAKGMKKWSY